MNWQLWINYGYWREKRKKKYNFYRWQFYLILKINRKKKKYKVDGNGIFNKIPWCEYDFEIPYPITWWIWVKIRRISDCKIVMLMVRLTGDDPVSRLPPFIPPTSINCLPTLFYFFTFLSVNLLWCCASLSDGIHSWKVVGSDKWGSKKR